MFKCWEDVDKTEHSFGAASVWDPADPITTADRPDQLTAYLNTGLPLSDSECWECAWLPACSGGCPNKRLHYTKQCLPYRTTPEKCMLALYERMIMLCDGIIDNSGSCLDLIGVKFLSSQMGCACF